MAELVTYPSTVEGFGNAFIETIYYRRPIVMSSYEIFRTDIQPKGFRVIEFEDFMTKETVDKARRGREGQGPGGVWSTSAGRPRWSITISSSAAATIPSRYWSAA